MLAGTYFPAGTIVGMSPLPVHLDRETFGRDAGEYVPERWIEGSVTPEGQDLEVEDMARYWIPFGVGSRMCIGRNVAMMEVSYSDKPSTLRALCVGGHLTRPKLTCRFICS